MFHRVLIMPPDYLICFATILTGIHRKTDICQTYIPFKLIIFPYFDIQAQEKAINHWMWCSLFYFFHSTVSDSMRNSVINRNNTWYFLHGFLKKTAIESQRERNILTCFNDKVLINNVKKETFSFYLHACLLLF